MENFEGQLNNEESLEDKFKSFEEGKKSFDKFFEEMGPIRKKAIIEGDDEMLEKLDKVAEKMQEVELKRIEERNKEVEAA